MFVFEKEILDIKPIMLCLHSALFSKFVFFKYYDKHVLSHTIKIDGDRRLFCDRMVIGFTPTLYQDAYQCPSLLKLCLHISLSDGVGWIVTSI